MQRQLQRSPDKNGPSQGHNRLLKTGRRKKGHDDEGKIEKNRCKGRNGEAAPCVENPAGEGDEGHEEDIGEGNARQFDGQGKFTGVGGKAGRRKIDEKRGARHAGQRDEKYRKKKNAGDPVGKLTGFFGLPGIPVFAQNRHKSLRKGAFGKEAA